jgi:hypothetical protein
MNSVSDVIKVEFFLKKKNIVAIELDAKTRVCCHCMHLISILPTIKKGDKTSPSIDLQLVY